MIKDSVEIINKLGLHARASTKLTQLASQYKSNISITRNGKRVDAKSIMGVMMLAASKGSFLELEADGPDESEAIEAIKSMINNYFDEGE
jgi:phosphocarrier protein HPr